MEDVLVRFAIVWTSLHLILFFIELGRYQRSTRHGYDFLLNGMRVSTYIVLAFDIIGVILAIIGGLLYWIVQPVI